MESVVKAIGLPLSYSGELQEDHTDEKKEDQGITSERTRKRRYSSDEEYRNKDRLVLIFFFLIKYILFSFIWYTEKNDIMLVPDTGEMINQEIVKKSRVITEIIVGTIEEKKENIHRKIVTKAWVMKKKTKRNLKK